jgi:hypothetical protein
MMNRYELIAYIDAISDEPVQGYYLDGPAELDDDWNCACWCATCGKLATARMDRTHGLPDSEGDYFRLSQCWSGDDSLEICGGNVEDMGCGYSLDTGGLSDYGIDYCIGIGEDPDWAYPNELRAAADAMIEDDPRWQEWERRAWILILDDGEATRWMNMDASDGRHL